MIPDPRLEYLEAVSSMLLKFKIDKWSKLIGAEENVALFTEFFDKADNLILVLTLNPAGMIIPCLGFPESLKSKGVYFIKKKPENITKDNYKARLIYGDISPTPVEQLIAVVEEVCVLSLGVEGLQGPPRLLLQQRAPVASPKSCLETQTAPLQGGSRGSTAMPSSQHWSPPLPLVVVYAMFLQPQAWAIQGPVDGFPSSETFELKRANGTMFSIPLCHCHALMLTPSRCNG